MSDIKTIYSDFSNKQLFGLFHSKNWSTNLTPHQRQQAMQELSIRYAKANDAQPVPLKVEYIDGRGKYLPSSNKIISSKHLTDDGITVSRGGHVRYYLDANLRSMSNVFHETTHAFQFQSVTNPQLYPNEETRKDLIANMHNYISSDYDLYRIQLMEKDANDRADAKTMAVMQSLEAEYGKDPSMKYYEGTNSGVYQECLRNAQLKYNDPKITETMQKAMNDNYYNGREIPLNEKTSYYQVRSILANEQLKKEIDCGQPNQQKIAALQKELSELSKQQALAEKREETMIESIDNGTLSANDNGLRKSCDAQAQSLNNSPSNSSGTVYSTDVTTAVLPQSETDANGVMENTASDSVDTAEKGFTEETTEDNFSGNTDAGSGSYDDDYNGMSM